MGTTNKQQTARIQGRHKTMDATGKQKTTDNSDETNDRTHQN